ncbi:cytochrome c-type biogenesis protein [Hydrocarboniphaga sp.]|uniref:cytochrome c-type biogenesis protein n=1 Tax=Hydrocarboniphaga sp. TaxID=2033016 RepID=UPI003D14234A
MALLFAICASATGADVPLDAQQQERYQTMISQLRCLVCQNQTIADSTAPLALDLRDQVHKQIAAGRSDTQIRTYLTDRYGDFVLYKPPLRPRTLLLWFGPFVLLAIALATVVMFTRRSRRRPSATTVDRQALQRLLSEQQDGR